MKRFSLFILLAIFSCSVMAQKSIYDYTVKDITGKEFPLSQLKGKKVLIVNTASKCGFTPQYKGLEQLYEKYKNTGFVIIGFPCNQFNKQDPGTNNEISEFCTKNYGVTFPMMGKINVKKGEGQAPLYQWLTDKSLNGVKSSSIKWNFQKYMIDEKGHLVDFVYSAVKPNDPRIVSWINGHK